MKRTLQNQIMLKLINYLDYDLINDFVDINKYILAQSDKPLIYLNYI
jgi:hypothetical protein